MFKGGGVNREGVILLSEDCDMTIDSLFRIETEAKVEKLNHMKLEVAQPNIKNKFELHVNKPYGISPCEELQS